MDINLNIFDVRDAIPQAELSISVKGILLTSIAEKRD